MAFSSRPARLAQASTETLTGPLPDAFTFHSTVVRDSSAPEPVVSKNTNELKTHAPGRFGIEVYAWFANGC